MSDPVLDALLSKDAEERAAEFPSDHKLARRYAEVQAKLEAARARASNARRGEAERAEARSEVEDLEASEEELRAELAPKMLRFRFRGIDGPTWERLRRENPVTKQQKDEARRNGEQVPGYNPDTFVPALLEAACVGVETPVGTRDNLTTDEWRQLWTSPQWNEAERATLQGAAVGAYLSRTKVDLPLDG